VCGRTGPHCWVDLPWHDSALELQLGVRDDLIEGVPDNKSPSELKKSIPVKKNPTTYERIIMFMDAIKLVPIVVAICKACFAGMSSEGCATEGIFVNVASTCTCIGPVCKYFFSDFLALLLDLPFLHYSKRRNVRRSKPSDIRNKPSEIDYFRRQSLISDGDNSSEIVQCPTAAVGHKLSPTAACTRRR
jgi:hypothetical protein